MRTTTKSIWAPRELNISGIRRLKLISAYDVDIQQTEFSGNITPNRDIEIFEFVFPADLTCQASWSLQGKDTGSNYWSVQISFELPHENLQIMSWVQDTMHQEWIAILELNNGPTRLMGGLPSGLKMNIGATTGSTRRSSNATSINLQAEQLIPYLELVGYENEQLFPEAGFTHGFSYAFES